MYKGIDISNHNGTIDFDRVKADGVEFIYIKATEGTTYIDSFLETNYNKAMGKGFKIGFYHFLVGSSLPETQAENFYKNIKDKQNDLKPCLDLEHGDNEPSNFMDYALRFIARFNQLSNMELCIYAGPYFTNDNLDSRLSHMSFWVSHYGVDTPMCNLVWGDGFSGHQYTDKGSVDGINGNVDLNNFNNDIVLGGQPVNVPQYVAPNVEVRVNRDEVIATLQDQCNIQGFSGQKVDGIPGVNTLDGCPALKHGSNGEITRCLQKLLNRHGYGLSEDGVFGDNTLNAVLDFQRINGLGQDGIVGLYTWQQLLGL